MLFRSALTERRLVRTPAGRRIAPVTIRAGRVARRLLEGDLTLAALGPIDGLESLDKIASRLAA